MRKATFLRRVQYNILKAWTVTSAGGGSTSASSVLAAESHPAKGAFGKDRKDFNRSNLSWVPAATRARCPPAQCTGIFNRRYSSAMESSPDVGGIVQVELAQTGEGIADCELLKWYVQEGDEVEEFQPLCEVQSDKASVEITSRYKGKISRVNFIPGDIVKVGETLLELVRDGQNVFTTSAVCPEEDHEQKKPSSVTQGSSSQTEKEVHATPAVRHLAKTYGINLADVVGSGKEGRILKDDVLKFVLSKEELSEEMRVMEPPAQDTEETDLSDSESEVEQPKLAQKEAEAMDSQLGGDKIVTVRGFRRIMAKTMTAAAFVPHFHYTEDVKVDALVELKDILKSVPTEKRVKLTYLPFLLKALSLALHKYPIMNSTVNQDATEITLRASHNIGVGIATDAGLVVPNIKNVQLLSIVEIGEELGRISQLAAANKLRTEDLAGGTITVSNFGSIGGKYGAPVLSVPEVAIVALGRIQKLPRFAEDGSVYPANIMGVTWGADHRVVDGATVASFCNEWKLIIEQPERFLLSLR